MSKGKKKKPRSSKTGKSLPDSAKETLNMLRDWKKMEIEPSSGELDPWQADACQKLDEGYNVIIDAPTSAGKTRIVEKFFQNSMNISGFRAVYTTPVKSLSNDKLKEFRELYGEGAVGISTGDFKENLGAPFVVATLESYRNSLLGVEPDLKRSLVVFDEYHYLQDISRGSAWEEAIILTPPTCQILMLSASVSNPEDFCGWLKSISPRDCIVISTSKRPVPLKNIVYYKDSWLLEETFKVPRISSKDPNLRFPISHQELGSRACGLVNHDLTPCIIYSAKRRSCEELVKSLGAALSPLDFGISQELRELIKKIAPVQSKSLLRRDLLNLMIRYGVGCHHSGLTPQARLIVEYLIKRGLLRFCVATMGLSLGINFSVKSTLVSDFSRPGESGVTKYSSSEILQMLGRAGRRGKDSVGYSIWPSIYAYKKFVGATREPCDSRLKNDATTFLGLVSHCRGFQDIEKFYKKSFLHFQRRDFAPKLIRKSVLTEQLAADMPCFSPSYSYAMHSLGKSSQCFSCDLIKSCHGKIRSSLRSDLAKMQVHLTRVGCLTFDNRLTELGNLGRFFPQAGGLIIANLIIQGEIREDYLLDAVQIMGSLSLAHYKAPRESIKPKKSFFDIEMLLEKFYPYTMFPEFYDTERNSTCFREFNPRAGEIVRDWAQGANWDSLASSAISLKFSQGDLISLLSRSMTYLQSLIQAQIPGLSEAARALRANMMRDPLLEVFALP